MNSRLLVIAAGLSLLIPAWIGVFSAGVPTLYAPFPTLTILPFFILSRWHLESLAVILPSIIFFLWSPGLLLSQRPNLPKRTIALMGLLTVLAAIDVVFEWNYGVQYQGIRYTLAVDMMNLLWLVFLWGAIIHFWRKPSFTGNLLSHWLLFVWLAWYAFPYLGELP